MIRSVCVFCGSSPGARAAYTEAAVALGQALVRRGLQLVYGGAQVGLMGTVADTVLAAGGEVVGVLPRGLTQAEIAHRGLTELHITDGLMQRKQLMADRSDAFVALPGGIGTLDELFEMLTWGQLAVHDKPVGLLDVDLGDRGTFWASLLQFLDHTVDERFLRAEDRERLLVETDPDRLLDRFEESGPVLDL